MKFSGENGRVLNAGYSWIFRPPEAVFGATVVIPMLSTASHLAGNQARQAAGECDKPATQHTATGLSDSTLWTALLLLLAASALVWIIFLV